MKKKRRHRRQPEHRSENPSASKRTALAISALLILLSLAAYARTISYDFVFDDENQILRNPWIREGSNLGRLFTTDVWRFSSERVSNYYRPLHMVLYMLGYRISGLKPEGYHLLNILLHALCTWLVFLIGARLLRNQAAAAAAGALFALHPVHAESVAWIAAVTDPLCGLFLFSALYFYLRDIDARDSGSADLVLSCLCFFAALLSKEMAFSFPLLAAWMDWSLKRRLRWRRYGLMILVFTVYLLLRVNALGRFQVDQVPLEIGLWQKLLTTLVLVATYVQKQFVPYGLKGFHDFSPARSLFSGEVLLAASSLTLFGWAAWTLRQRREAVFLFGFSLISLIPLLNLSGLSLSVFADRYIYIPSMGSCLLIPLIGGEVWKRRPESWAAAGKPAAVSTLGALLAVYGFSLWRIMPLWSDSYTFYSGTMRQSPTSALIANNLARYHLDRGDLAEAQEWYSRAEQLWHTSMIKNRRVLALIYNGRGGVLFRQQRYGEALQYFQLAYETAPGEFITLRDLGLVHAALGDYARALAYYRQALTINPRNEVTYNNIAAVALAQGDYDEAIRQAGIALSIYPRLSGSYMIMGRAYRNKGMYADARSAYQKALDLDPGLAEMVKTEMEQMELNPH